MAMPLQSDLKTARRFAVAMFFGNTILEEREGESTLTSSG
jgi:hypothetical protein